MYFILSLGIHRLACMSIECSIIILSLSPLPLSPFLLIYLSLSISASFFVFLNPSSYSSSSPSPSYFSSLPHLFLFALPISAGGKTLSFLSS